MPKDEFDHEDPMELMFTGLLTKEDTMTPMAECFIEEFMLMGYNHKQLLALFKNPFYAGPHMVLQQRGEVFVQKLITDTLAKWGRKPQPLITDNR